MRASSRAGREWMSLPSRVTVPPAGLSSRDRPRSSVDFPQALAPDDHRHLALGNLRGEALHDAALIVLQREVPGFENSHVRRPFGWR